MHLYKSKKKGLKIIVVLNMKSMSRKGRSKKSGSLKLIGGRSVKGIKLMRRNSLLEIII